MDATFASRPRAAAVPGSKSDLEIERLRLQNEKLRFELSVRQKDYTANADVELWVGNMVMQSKRVLLAIPGKLAPQLLGLATEAEVERRLKEEINAALSLLSSKPLGDYDPKTAAEPAPPAAEPAAELDEEA